MVNHTQFLYPEYIKKKIMNLKIYIYNSLFRLISEIKIINKISFIAFHHDRRSRG